MSDPWTPNTCYRHSVPRPRECQACYDIAASRFGQYGAWIDANTPPLPQRQRRGEVNDRAQIEASRRVQEDLRRLPASDGRWWMHDRTVARDFFNETAGQLLEGHPYTPTLDLDDAFNLQPTRPLRDVRHDGRPARPDVRPTQPGPRTNPSSQLLNGTGDPQGRQDNTRPRPRVDSQGRPIPPGRPSDGFQDQMNSHQRRPRSAEEHSRQSYPYLNGDNTPQGRDRRSESNRQPSRSLAGVGRGPLAVAHRTARRSDDMQYLRPQVRLYDSDQHRRQTGTQERYVQAGGQSSQYHRSRPFQGQSLAYRPAHQPSIVEQQQQRRRRVIETSSDSDSGTDDEEDSSDDED